MITVYKGIERGTTKLNWLDSRHTFSFGDFFDPSRHQFRSLRVINEDWIAPGSGFPSHPHRDMEILTCVLSGSLEHRDSTGNGEVIRAGEWQGMTAGTGISHSEFNASNQEPVHLLQIWLFPDQRGHSPSYRSKTFPADGKRGKWQLTASPDGEAASLVIHQDARVYQTTLVPDTHLTHEIARGRAAFVHVSIGVVAVNGQRLTAGDSIAIEGETTIRVACEEQAELLLFDLG